MARDGLSNMREPKVLPADLKCCECLQATLKPAQWRCTTQRKNTDQNRSSFEKGDASATSTAQVLKRLARTRSIYFEDQPARPSTFACCTSFPVPYLDSKAAAQKKMRQKPAENCVCLFCRRTAYAKGCVGRKVNGRCQVLTRWQEWCAPFIKQSCVLSAADVLALVKQRLASFLNTCEAFVATLCYNSAELRSWERGCTCRSDADKKATDCSKKEGKKISTGKRTTGNKADVFCWGHSKWWKDRQCRWVGRRRQKFCTCKRRAAVKVHKAQKNRLAAEVQGCCKQRGLVAERNSSKKQVEGGGEGAGERNKHESTPTTMQRHPLVLPQAQGSADCFGVKSLYVRQVHIPNSVHQTKSSSNNERKANNNGTNYCEAMTRWVRYGRFQGGGAERLQCFICLAYKRAFVPKQWSDEYVTHCRTCGRGACNKHGAWEVGQFHCALCHGNDDPLLSGAKDTFAIRCLNKAFQKQELLHRNEEAFHDFMLALCAERTNLRMEATYKDEALLDAQPQEAANTVLTWEDAQQLVVAILLSRLGTAEDAAKVLGQSWVPTWDGWKELQTSRTEAHCVAIADRLCDIAQVNAPGRSMTDTQALKALAAEGFRWQQALSHGVNNCLIDSLMLCLAYEGLLPSNLGADVAARRRIAVACRKHLVQAVGQAVLPSAKGFFHI